MINYLNAVLSPISIHHIGRKVDDEGFSLSDIPTTIEDENIKSLVLKYFLSGYKEPAFHNFKMTGDETYDNPIFENVSKIFEDPQSLHYVSGDIAKYLYNNSNHPNIKSGELMVCYFQDILVEDELLDAIGIFKCESRAIFLKLLRQNLSYDFTADEGIALGGLDKGCLILNTEKEDGYKLCVIDKANATEAYFWNRDFLSIKERTDDYHNTSHYINLTKDFVEDRLKPKHDLGRDDELRIMNSSEKFFNSNESFSEKEYLNSLFDNVEVLEEFEDYKQERQEIQGYQLESDFDISDAAVKKNNKVFRSVIKLDKNFHIYVHGERSKIERGTDEMGRKFYKLYYDNES